VIQIIPDRVHNMHIHPDGSDGSDGVPQSRRKKFLLMQVVGLRRKDDYHLEIDGNDMDYRLVGE
jgi:hypothetical protein